MRRALAVVVPLAVVLALALWRAQGPEPKPGDAGPNEFSAARAMATLQALLVDGVPHPIGTHANERVRSRIVTQLRVLGYEATVQRRFACNAAAGCGMMANVLARQPGTRGETVLVMAHYDSVGAGVGASDDGVGTATLLEVARALQGRRFRNPVSFLFTDAEENGLLGAEGFIADEALSRDVSAVVNVDMRGTYGPSNMFETSTGNRWLIRHLSRALDRPNATSLFYAVYTLLPNDTDVTIFKRAGKAAVNFAASRGVYWYHTPYDDLAHVNERTLQHHGDNVLGAVRALAESDLAARSSTDATYFDILGYTLVWWPQEWTLWMAIASLILLVIAARKEPPREMTFGVLTMFVALLLAALMGFGVSWMARLRSEGLNFVAGPTPSVAAMWLAGFSAALFAVAIFRKRATPLPMLYGIAIVWHTIGIAIALTLPGAAYLFIVPAIAVTLCAVLKADALPTSVTAATVGAILIFPMGLMLYDALGGRLMLAIAVLIGALSAFVTPLFGRFFNASVVAILSIVCAGMAMMQPAYIAERPRPISLSYIDDPAAPSPYWFTGTTTPTLRGATTFTPADAKLTPWTGGGGWTAPAPRLSLPRVTISGSRDGERLTVHVRSSRNANRVVLLLRGDAKVLRVNGVTPPPRPERFRERVLRGWQMAVGSGVEEMTVECTVRGPIEAVASDMTFGLPPAGAALTKARDATPAIPIQDGDVTLTRTRTRY